MIYDYDGQWYPGMDGAYVSTTFVLQFSKNSGTKLNQKTDLTEEQTWAR